MIGKVERYFVEKINVFKVIIDRRLISTYIILFVRVISILDRLVYKTFSDILIECIFFRIYDFE